MPRCGAGDAERPPRRHYPAEGIMIEQSCSWMGMRPILGNAAGNERPRGGHSMRKTAFTLIELLVVIAIIAILAAILFPVFAQARDKARGAACLSNTKQMGLGVSLYTQDYDEVLPMGGNGGPT